ncbi:MAG: DUF72 domain-containing protein [Burkholderiales bacterium]
MIRVGVGGWTYAPWRSNFYPEGLTHKRELEYASRKLTSIEINGTFYRTQSAASFAKWRDETPDDFVFSVKAPRYATNRALLAEAGDSVERFFTSGLAELGPKLGPILWQFSAFKRFEPEDFERFLALLPPQLGARRLRHVLDVRHKSFATTEFVALARRHQAAVVFSDTDEFPAFADVTADFVYARLMRSAASEPTGYSAAALNAWAQRAKTWESGWEPDDLPRIDAPAGGARAGARDVFVYFISGAKERAPAAACVLLSML